MMRMQEEQITHLSETGKGNILDVKKSPESSHGNNKFHLGLRHCCRESAWWFWLIINHLANLFSHRSADSKWMFLQQQQCIIPTIMAIALMKTAVPCVYSRDYSLSNYSCKCVYFYSHLLKEINLPYVAEMMIKALVLISEIWAEILPPIS